jgi:hypothetical protein
MQSGERNLRHELKFVISQSTYVMLRERISPFLARDPHMPSPDGYMVDSLYFDDFLLSGLQDKSDGLRYRKKFRIRAYNQDATTLNLESKTKLDNLTRKEKTGLSRQEYDEILDGRWEALARREEKMCHELYGMYHRRLLAASAVVRYQREAYTCAAGDFRLTFDKNLQTRSRSLDIFAAPAELESVLLEAMLVMEIKYSDYLPPYLGQLLSVAELQRSPLSKYELCKKKRMRSGCYD